MFIAIQGHQLFAGKTLTRGVQQTKVTIYQTYACKDILEDVEQNILKIAARSRKLLETKHLEKHSDDRHHCQPAVG